MEILIKQSFDGESLNRIKEMAEYFAKANNIKVQTIYPDQVTFSINTKNFYRAKICVMSEFLFFFLPKFLSIGITMINFEDLDKFITNLYELYKIKSSTEEIEEDVPQMKDTCNSSNFCGYD